MTLSHLRTAILMLCAAATLAACNRSENAGITAPTEAEPGSRPDAAASTPSEIQTAAATLQGVIDALAAGNAKSVVAALPPHELERLDERMASQVTTLAPKVREEIGSAIASLAETLTEKEAFVLGSDRVELSGPAAEFVRDHFAALCRVTGSLARWPGWTAQQSSDATAVLAELVRGISSEPTLVDALRALRVRQVDGDEAAVKIVVDGRTGDTTIRMEQVEGQWVPASLVRFWASSAETAEEQSDVKSREERLREFASHIREVERSLAEVSTQQEFDALADRASALLLATAAQAERGPRPLRSEEFATLIVQGRLTERQKDQLVWDVASSSDEPNSSIADGIDDTGREAFVITLGPVSDLDAFAGRLTGLQVEQIDEESRTITARYGAP